MSDIEESLEGALGGCEEVTVQLEPIDAQQLQLYAARLGLTPEQLASRICARALTNAAHNIVRILPRKLNG